MNQAAGGNELLSPQLRRGLMRPLVAVVGATVSAAAGLSAVWAVGVRAAGGGARVSPVRSRRGRG